MQLNTLSPNPGSRQVKKRVGRGMGSGLGKTCGRGHKGQKSRSGGFHKVGFEGGQMPLQRRLPKIGFRSLTSKYAAELPLYALNKVKSEIVDLDVLKNEKLIPNNARTVKIINTGQLDKAFTIKHLNVTKGAKQAIEAAGGKIEE